MKRSWFILAVCTLLSVGAVASREAVSQNRAQNRPQNPQGRAQVCVYEHAGYGGFEQCYGVGERIPDLGDRRNRISSVRIFGRAEIALYQHPNFEGRELILDQDVSDLSRSRGWNDETDSIRVEGASFGGRPRPGQNREDRICVYQHTEYRGKSQCFDAGDEVRDLRQIGWNDGVSSIRTFGRTRVAFYEDSGFQGQRLIVEQDIPDLTQLGARGGGSWNDRISSLRAADARWRN